MNDTTLRAPGQGARILRGVGHCCYCGAPATTSDHVVPGGRVRDGACLPCNASKGCRTPEQWVEAMLRHFHGGTGHPDYERRLWFMLCPLSLVVQP